MPAIVWRPIWRSDIRVSLAHGRGTVHVPGTRFSVVVTLLHYDVSYRPMHTQETWR